MTTETIRRIGPVLALVGVFSTSLFSQDLQNAGGWPDVPTAARPASAASHGSDSRTPLPDDVFTATSSSAVPAVAAAARSTWAPQPPQAPGPWQIGDYKLVPYGVLWADMIYATERTNPGAFTLFVFSPEQEGEPAFSLDARRTRVGFNLTGPDVSLLGGAKTGGQLEIDFFGQFVNENQAGVQLRHAYWEAKNDRWRMLVGQYWDIISPLIPGTLNYSVGWAGGNIGFRRPQFRWERYWDISPNLWGIWQVSLNQDVVPDFATTAGIDRESSCWPVIESRVGWKLGDRGPQGLPVEIGMSGHIGETGFDFRGIGPPPSLLPLEDDGRFLSWSVNADVKVPVSDRWGFQGEYFFGANLSPYLGGIGQGVCPCTRTAVRDSGGWAEIWYRWNPQWRSNFGFGIDDPNNRDIEAGRSYNRFLFGNIVHEFTSKFSMGFEVTYWTTSYIDKRVGQVPPEQLGPTEQGNSFVFQWMCQYGF